MKTSLKNQYSQTNQVLIFLVSAVFGYNLYLAIVYPEKSHLVLSLVLLAMTYFVCRKYGYKTMKEKDLK
jgi:FtsH-binding integral membrane protein